MGSLHCVRHGQASFGAANYDQLSPLGERQAQALGSYWAQRGKKFDAVIVGTLARHRQTLQNIAQTLFLEPNQSLVTGSIGLDATEFIANATSTSALNEYDSEALIHAQLARAPQFLPDLHTPEGYKAHFRVLRDALQAWIGGELTPASMPSFADFRSGIAEVLSGVALSPRREVLVVSSGGPLSTAMMHVLQAPPLSMIDLNYQMKNTAVTRFHVSTGKLHLSGFNDLSHLDAPQFAGMQTST